MPTGTGSAVINGPMNWHSLVDALVATMLPKSTVTTGLELEFSALATASLFPVQLRYMLLDPDAHRLIDS